MAEIAPVPSGRKALHLVDEDADERPRVVHQVLDHLEHLLHQLAGLGEPLAEERMTVDLDQVAVVEARAAVPDAQLVRQSLRAIQ